MPGLENYRRVTYLSDREANPFRARLAVVEKRWKGRVGNLEKLFAFMANYRFWGENIWEIDEAGEVEDDVSFLEVALDGLEGVSLEELADSILDEADNYVERSPWDFYLIYLALKEFNKDWAEKFIKKHDLTGAIGQSDRDLLGEVEGFHKKTANVSVGEWDRDTCFWRLGFLLNYWVKFQEEAGSEEYKQWGKADQAGFQQAWVRLGWEAGEVLEAMLDRGLVVFDSELELPFIENRVRVSEVMRICGLYEF